MADVMRERLATYEQQLQEQVARRTNLKEALDACDANVKRLEGACGALRELLQTAEPPAVVSTGNGADPLPEEPEV